MAVSAADPVELARPVSYKQFKQLASLLNQCIKNVVVPLTANDSG
jgi:hypothetical protein